jgi:chemotaxis protein CheX
MEEKFFALLSEAAREVFETMAFLDVTEQPAIRDRAEMTDVEMTAIIALAGEISGFLALHGSKALFRKCGQLMTGGEKEFSDEDLCDVAGEMADTIAGAFKRRLATLIDLFYIALPILIYGRGHRLRFPGKQERFPHLFVPFMTDGKDRFYVEMLYHRR